MHTVTRFFPEVSLDNDILYMNSLSAVIEACDEYAELEISKFPECYSFRLIPSLPKYTNIIIEEILKLSNLCGIKIDMGKSIKSTSVITFKIQMG